VLRILVSGELGDVVPVAVEAEGHPAGFSSEFSELGENTELVGEDEGADRTCSEASGSGDAMALPAELPPGLEQGADRFSKGRELSCPFPGPGRRL
jgi:hypothetical protein